MPRAAAVALLLLAFAAAPAHAQSPFDPLDPADPPAAYCPGTPGEAASAPSDAEHRRIVPDRAPPASVTRRRITVDGIATQLLEAGPRDGTEAVVFVHGNPGSARDYDDLLADAGQLVREHLVTDVVPFEDGPRLLSDLAARRRRPPLTAVLRFGDG